MSHLPPYLQEGSSKKHKICLVVEGFEEEFYFKRLCQFNYFSQIYHIQVINAKAESNVPAVFQDNYRKDLYKLVLVVCDMDRKPEEYAKVIEKIDLVLGPGKSSHIVFFTRPCTLQLILLHFGDVTLSTQAKKVAQPLVEQYTGVPNYDAHQDQLKIICGKIFQRSYGMMKSHLEKISTDPREIPSTNMKRLFDHLESNDPTWIKEINDALNDE